MKRVWYYDFPIGRVGIVCNDNGITNVTLSEVDAVEEKCAVIEEAAKQLDEYFRGERKVFDLPLSFHGTDFQKAVWNALSDIPYGETRSYKDIAIAIGNPDACRAVGMANNRNRLMIIIPCHRVIGANGSLTGFGAGLGVKKYLLELEKGLL